MDYQLNTHCPNCFKPSDTAVCGACHFDKEAYLNHHAAAHHLPLFTQLEKSYIIGRVLGEGHFSIVYAAIREKDLLNCAVKEYYPRDLAQRGLDQKTVKPKNQLVKLDSWKKRFIQEAELLRTCYDHPTVESGVVHYTTLIKQHNTAYLVMERLTGMTVNDYLNQHGKFSPDKICLWLKPLLETLRKLHDKDIYHRDISTHNIFLSAANKPVLMDFGLAREGAKDELLKLSTLSAGVFIAPEQLNNGYCDQRTDLYSLGAVIYYCLHGEAPPSIEARKQGALLKTLNSADTTTQALQTAAVHCLQLNLNLRPKNAEHLLAQLFPVLTEQNNIFSVGRVLDVPRATPSPNRYVDEPILPQNLPLDFNLRPPLAKPNSFLRGLFVFFTILCSFIALGYGAFLAYQHYDVSDTARRREDNLLFSQAQSLADYKAYLTKCVTCENQQRAMERIALLEQEQQSVMSQQKQQEQEALLFTNAKTAEEFKAYLSSCVLCTDKTKAEEKLAQLNEIIKLADETQLAEQEKEIAEAVKSKGSSVEFYQLNCPKNLPFWQRTAELGYTTAQLFLGGCYRNGDGVTQNYTETLKWYRRAAELGNVYAQNNLAVMYQKGEGMAPSDAEAIRWYQKAAEQGDSNAQYQIGVMYEKGQGITQDYKKAVDWYLRAAEQNNADAQHSLGLLYHYGSGVDQDYQAALMWYRKAAMQGNDKAQYLLGIMYENGYGVTIDDQIALSWYQKAASQGNPDAIAQMKTLEAMNTINNHTDRPAELDAPPTTAEIMIPQ
jgi:TPR repeat protein/serine/threonine protein kinase